MRITASLDWGTDLVVWFVRSADDLARGVARVASDAGLVDFRICAIDAT